MTHEQHSSMEETPPILYVACLVSIVFFITWLFLFSIFSSRRASLAQSQQATEVIAHDTRKAKGKDWFEVVCKPSESNNFAIGIADRVSVVVINP